MFKSLYAKLAAVLTGLFCLVGLSMVAITAFSTEMYQQEVIQRLNKNLASQIVAQNPLIKDNQVNKSVLKEIFHSLMVINPGIEVYLLNPKGKILAFSAPPGKVKRDRVDLTPVKNWIGGDTNLPLLGDDPRSLSGKKVFSAAKILDRGNLQGYLYVILGGQNYDSVVRNIYGSYILRISAWMVFASLLFALVTGLILFALLTGRLRRLAQVVDDFKIDGTLQHSNLPLKNNREPADEIDRLSFTFKEMAERIEDQMEKLRKSDALRRELIANVSHDLRSPLTTLKVYLETLLIKEKRLSQTEQKNYLETAIQHCERLNRLVGNLLELAKLESLEIKPSQEPFNISELVLDIIQKFHLSAKEKDVTVRASIDKNLPFVCADIGMIERVLENLIENALSHTPARGKVCIELAESENEVSVRVIDTGPGIPLGEIPYIFDRFYQASRTGGGNLSHLGLGLAIAKKILELHDRTLIVTSCPGRGSTFAFNLPACHSS